MRIFAIEDSQAIQRAEQTKLALAAAADDTATKRLQRQFRKKGAPEPEAAVKLSAEDMFRLVDTDGSGHISADEMREHMLLRGYMDDEIDTALKVLDVDGDGQVRLPAPTPHAPFA